MLASPCLVQIVRGMADIPVVNVGMTEVFFYPHTGPDLSGAHPVSLTEVRPITATVSCQVAATSVVVDLSLLTEPEQTEVLSLLQKNSSVYNNSKNASSIMNFIKCIHLHIVTSALCFARHRLWCPAGFQPLALEMCFFRLQCLSTTGCFI